MKIQKRLPALLFAIVLLFAMNMTVYAHEAVDMSRTGSVIVMMKYDGNPVPGGALTVYRVGSVVQENGDYHFALTEEFAGSRAVLDDLSSVSLAETLAAYAKNNGLAGRTIGIGNDGVMTADGLEVGLYLIVQTAAAQGYEAVNPFLVSVPMNEDGHYIYDVDATPKLGTLTRTPPETPETPETPEEPEVPQTPGTPVTPQTPGTPVPDVPAKTILPQTGQLNWPVPVMAALGLCLILIGWKLRLDREEMPYEA